MSRFLQLKHWQLFLLLIGIPILFQVFVVSFADSNRDPKAMIVVLLIVMLLVTGIFFTWFYALGAGLHKKLPASVRMNLTRFKIFLVIPVIYIAWLFLFMTFAMRDANITGTSALNIAGIIVPIHLFSIFCTFYCLYFIAKELKSVEWQRPVTFSDFAGEFFLIWFFPIGIWIIQPRVNRLFSHELEGEDNFLNHSS